jgi:hypothetical protein
MALARANPQTGIPPLIYHSGGETMLLATIHSIYWVPPTLQSGAPSAFGTLARELMYDLASDYHGHSIGNNNTQCYKIMTKTYYIQNAGAATKPVVDASSYPKSDCTDTLTSDNCILDSDIQAEIMKVMTVENWAAGSTALFVVHTAQGEGSCVSAGNCAYGQYCSYHSFINGSQPIIYAYIPYGSVKHCQAANTPSPNHQANVDAGINQLVATITNAITDPQMNAWFTSSGEESSELCAYNFEVASWDFNGQQYLANQFWNGHYYEVQTEPDNHTQSCVQVGP